MSLLGIDVGTTGCKVIAFNIDGEIIAQAYDEYPLIHPKPDWSELDPRLVWEKVSTCIQEVASQTRSDSIKALSVSSQGEAVTPVSKTGEILDNAITTFDYRATEIADEIGEKISRMKVMRLTGMPLSGIKTVPKLIWLRRNKPEVYKKTWKFLGFEDFIIYKLGMAPVVDYSLASCTMAFDVVNKEWSDEILSLADIDAELFSRPEPSGTIIGEIEPKIADKLGFPKKVVGVAGGHDQPCGALGSGIIHAGRVIDATGTVECITPAFDQPVINRKMLDGNFSCNCHVVDGMYVTLAYVSSGGVILRWYRDNFAKTEVEQARSKGIDVYDILMEQASDEPSSLLLLPHFSGTGTPYLDTKSKGAILGFSLSTEKGDLIKAILEGISLEIKHNINLIEEAGIPVNEIRAIGGGAKSEKWLQLKADVFGKKVVSLDVSEGVCLGAAILAGTAIGKYDSIESAVDKLVKPKKEYFPRPPIQEFYEERLELYRQIYPSVRAINHELSI